ncbi:hypothetical protein ISS03_04595, partial [Patescibacteria group bacterium]|nr:hypothetical protein [Patescibacteria group bacterium]
NSIIDIKVKGNPVPIQVVYNTGSNAFNVKSGGWLFFKWDIPTSMNDSPPFTKYNLDKALNAIVAVVENRTETK